MTGWLLALVLTRALDVGTTCVALAHGGREVNPLLPASCPAQLAIQSGVATADVLLLRRLAPAHPRVARVLAGVEIGLEGTVGVHNAIVVYHLSRPAR